MPRRWRGAEDRNPLSLEPEEQGGARIDHAGLARAVSDEAGPNVGEAEIAVQLDLASHVEGPRPAALLARGPEYRLAQFGQVYGASHGRDIGA